MPRKKTETKTEAKPVAPAAPTLKQLVRAINSGDRPRGLKVAANADGGYTFSYGPKSAPVAVMASKDELAALGLASIGIKLS